MSRPSSALRHFLAGRSLPARRRLREAGEEGFTLIELIIVIVILPLVIGAVAVALIVTLSDSAGISAKVASSVDAQITSAFYGRDVQSSQYVTTSIPATTPWPAAAGTAVCTSGTAKNLVLSLAWGSGTKLATGATEESVVSYWRGDLAGGSGSVSGKTLTATGPAFAPGDAGQAVVQTNGSSIPFGTTIASYVSPTQVTLTKTATGSTVSFEVGPTLTRKFCVGGTAPSKVTTSHDFFTPFLRAIVSCIPTSTTCTKVTSAWIPAQPVTSVALGVMEPSGKYDYNVSASPRVSNATGNTACEPSVCTAGGGTVPTLLLLGGSTRVIKESSATTHVTVVGTTQMNTGYFQQNNGSTFKTTKGESTNVAALCTGPTAKCTTIQPPQHSWTQTTTPTPDPFAGLHDPPPATTRGCPAPTTLELTPGLYTCTIKVNGSGHVLTLKHGAYEFSGGVSVTGGAKLTGMSGVFIYLPCKTVDSWDPVTSCSESFTVKNSYMTVKTLRTGPYAGFWYWQNKGDTTTAQISGPGGFSTTGIMYAPGAEVKLSGGSGIKSTLGVIIALVLWVLNGTFVIYGIP